MAERFTVGRASAIGTDESVPLADVRFGFRNGYVLEIVRLGVERAGLGDPAGTETLDIFVFPLAPRRYQLSEPFAAAVTPTQGDTVVAEEYGQIIREATIEGTFGLSKKRVSGFVGVQGNGNAISGNEHFIRLRQFFRSYGLLKQNPGEGYRVQMRWHSLRDDDHFIVIPTLHETPRDAKMTRVHYDYRITMKIVGTVDDVNAPSVSEDTGNFFDDAARSITNAFNDARAAFADITANISQVQRKLGNIQAIMINAAGLINAVGNGIRSAGNLINYPFQLATTVTEQIAQASDDLSDAITAVDPTTVEANAARSLREMERAFNRVLAFGDRFVDTQGAAVAAAYEGERRLTARDVADGTAGATPGSTTRVAYGSEGGAYAPFGGSRAVRAETVTAVTTVTGLAARYGVSPEDIILLNDLRPPYFAPGGGPGVLGPGDEVLVPVPSSTSAALAGSAITDYATADELLYGRDLAIDMDYYRRTGRFELMEDLVHGGTDAVIVGGIPNVVQGTLITVETERGSTIYLPDIGVRRTPGQKGTMNNVLLASLSLREAILADPRFDGVESASVVLDGDVLTQEITPRLIGGRSDVTLVRPFGRASGGS